MPAYYNTRTIIKGYVEIKCALCDVCVHLYFTINQNCQNRIRQHTYVYAIWISHICHNIIVVWHIDSSQIYYRLTMYHISRTSFSHSPKFMCLLKNKKTNLKQKIKMCVKIWFWFTSSFVLYSVCTFFCFTDCKRLYFLSVSHHSQALRLIYVRLIISLFIE